MSGTYCHIHKNESHIITIWIRWKFYVHTHTDAPGEEGIGILNSVKGFKSIVQSVNQVKFICLVHDNVILTYLGANWDFDMSAYVRLHPSLIGAICSDRLVMVISISMLYLYLFYSLSTTIKREFIPPFFVKSF